MNCDLISSKHSPLTNLETCTLDALYQLLVKYYTFYIHVTVHRDM